MPKVIDLDDSLVEAMRNGNEAALGTVIQRYTAYAGTIVWSIAGGRLTEADAKEILSDVFYMLWKNQEKIQDGKLKAYLGRIARSRALDALRGAGEDTYLEEDLIVLPVPGPENEAVRTAVASFIGALAAEAYSSGTGSALIGKI